MGDPRRLVRTRATWAGYGAVCLLGYWQNGLGTVLLPLRQDLGVTVAQVAFYPSLFAGALVVTGLFGARVVGRIGRGAGLRLAVVTMATGAVLLCWPVRPVSVAGAMVMGTGSALILQVVPVSLAAEFPEHAQRVNAESSGMATVLSVAVPWLVAGAIAVGLGWRVGYLALPLVLAGLVLLAVPRAAAVATPGGRDDPLPGRDQPLLGRWVMFFLAVAAEFCCLLWAVEALRSWHGLPDAAATAALSAFLVGMGGGRTLLSSALSGTSVRVVVQRQTVIAAAGFALFWCAPWWPLAVAGLLVVGVGLSVLYPVGVAHALAAWPSRPDAAASRTLLASGIAIGGAPWVLARLADLVGIRLAYLVVPVILALLLAVVPWACPAAGRVARPAPPHGPLGAA